MPPSGLLTMTREQPSVEMDFPGGSQHRLRSALLAGKRHPGTLIFEGRS
jgi:hypothetical protein